MGSQPRRLAALVAGGLLVGLAAHAFIPQVDRVVKAVSKQNAEAGRARPLRLELVLRIEDSEPIGSGVLITHPTGLARLELRGTGDLVERHVLQGREHLATRNGEPLDEPRAFLPPLFLLQTGSALDLRAGLEQIGANLDAIGLAPCGESDCYVIGDPTRVPPRVEPVQPVAGSGDHGDWVDPVTGAPYRPVPPPPAADRLTSDVQYPTIWVDLVTYEPRRIDLSDGVRVWLGPAAVFGDIRMPAWIRIDEPGRRPVTFDVLGVSAVSAPAAAFSRSWLATPAPPADEGTSGPLSGENP